MIPNQEKTVTISGSSNLDQARSQQMGLDSHSLPHLMRVLTNLYSDPEMAVIREYSTNAYDSHVEAGKAGTPIHVSLPNVFSQEFVVRDFGVGMSEDEVFEIFGLYGASTKRESNDYVGQLGLGCKSALTLTNQFSLTAIKDGIKCVFSVHLDELGIGKITKLHEEVTDSGNGVEISVPIKEVNSFNRKAKRFYRFFSVLPNFVGGVAFPEEMVPEVIMEVEDGLKVIKAVQDDEGKDYIIMGGVAYPFRHDSYYQRIVSGGTIVIDAPIGSVDFTPSREELHMTTRTKEFIAAKYESVKFKIRSKMEAQINQAKDVWEFHKLLEKYSYDLNRLGIRTFLYRGQSYDVTGASYLPLPNSARIYSIGNRRLSIDHGYRKVYYNSLLSHSFVVNDTGEEPTSYVNSKIKTWLRASSSVSRVVLLPQDYDVIDEYKEQAHSFLSLKELKKQVKVLSSRGKKETVYERVTISNAYHLQDALNFDKMEVDEDEDIIYVLKADLKDHVDAIKRVKFAGEQIFAIGKTQEATFLKRYPTAISLHEYLEKRAEAILAEAGKSEEEKFVIAANRGGLENRLSYIAGSLPHKWEAIEDPKLQKLVKFVRLYKVSETKTNTSLSNILKAARYLFLSKHGVESKTLTLLTANYGTLGKTELEEVNGLYKELRDKYPLLLNDSRSQDHLIQYANMVAKGE